MRPIRRRDFAELPPSLVAEVERRLGAVLRFEERRGGFSDGVLGVATLAGGERVFVKAVPAHGADADGYREEAAVSAALPPAVPAPRLRFMCEKGGWVLLCSEVAPGRVPHEPWRPEELSAALDLLTACARELTPAPLDGLPTVAARMAGRCEIWQDPGAARVGEWERDHLPRLAETEREWESLVTGDTMLHFDPRFDNIVIDEHGTARLVDWGRACVGPAWVDLVCLLLESDLGEPDPEEVFAGHPLGKRAVPEHVDALLVALLGYWTRTAAIPGPSHAPHLRDRREHSRRATLAWLSSRWG
ncbi:phosphotransferase [Nonomuraea sp. NPDC049784]|uniref:phosphotransferase n=1 Tax=Nonomuraea sp. NPDC049784 TaxID=3154361 RepID=UPI0033CD9E87